MTLQYEPASDPDWDHLRMILSRGRVDQPPKRRNYWYAFEIVALAILSIGIGLLVRFQVAEASDSAINYAIEQFEQRITYLGQQAWQTIQPPVVHAQPAPQQRKVSKAKKAVTRHRQ